MDKKTCFVLMGFGVKVDYKTNRSLDLDKTYKIIRAAVESAGLECIRADDIVHSGVIDKPMYEQLLGADVAIADLSTSNENAIYELGVRHALKPFTTIVIAEKQFRFPFDLGHLLIRPYEHLGTGIDFEEAQRLQNALTTAIQIIQPAGQVDSPVYTFLPGLAPPALGAPKAPATGAIAAAAADRAAPASDSPDAENPKFTVLLEAFRDARAHADFALARTYLEKLVEFRQNDPYLVQQLALATYKSERPTVIEALRAAKAILERLNPESSGDPETLGLWGAIHKRLWEDTGDRAALDEGIAAYERGFFMKRDSYTGINYAFMLDDRAHQQSDSEEATADRVLAKRVRRQLLSITRDALNAMPRAAGGGVQDPSQWYWLRAAQVEALMALHDPNFCQARDELLAEAPESWMKQATEQQLAKLADLQK